MSVLAQTIINAALTELQVIAIGDTPETAHSNWGLLVLNRLISQWQTKKRFVYAFDDLTFTIGSSKQSYSIGASGADWTAARPIQILSANLVRTSVTPNERAELEVIEVTDYAQIAIPAETSVEPYVLYYQATVPNGTIWLWPYPVAGNTIALANQIELFVRHRLDSFADLGSTAVNLPDGYEDALTYALAKRLAPHFGKAWTENSEEMYKLALEAIRSANAGAPKIDTRDSGMPGASYRTTRSVDWPTSRRI